MSGSRRQGALLAILLLIAIATPVAVWTSARPSQSAFIDVEGLGENRLGSGRLDLVVGNTSTTLSAENVAPGDRLDGTLVLDNAGDLPLRYTIRATVRGAELAPWVRWWLTEPASSICQPGTEITVPTVIANGTSIDLIDPGERSVLAGSRDVLCLIAEVRLEAPNSVQGRSVDIDLSIFAEHDSELVEAGP